jgi:hypothetical protein
VRHDAATCSSCGGPDDHGDECRNDHHGAFRELIGLGGSTPLALPVSRAHGLVPSAALEELEERDRIRGARFYSALGRVVLPAIEELIAGARRLGAIGPSTWGSCSWCDTLNELEAGVAVFCRICDHRADLPRIECDCGALGCLAWWPTEILDYGLWR